MSQLFSWALTELSYYVDQRLIFYVWHPKFIIFWFQAFRKLLQLHRYWMILGYRYNGCSPLIIGKLTFIIQVWKIVFCFPRGKLVWRLVFILWLFHMWNWSQHFILCGIKSLPVNTPCSFLHLSLSNRFLIIQQWPHM